MSRIVYVGGFANGRSSAEKVGNALGEYFEDVDTFTFSDYVNDEEKVESAIRGAEFMGHSAGALVLKSASPEFAHLICPPMPRKIGSLVLRSSRKTRRMLTPGVGIHNLSDAKSVANYSASAVAELVFHPVANLGQLKSISNYDACSVVSDMQSEGIPARIAWTWQDAFYAPSEAVLHRAHRMRVPHSVFEGEHDELVLRPEAFLKQLFDTV